MADKKTFSWLHFSDLHWGTSEMRDRWSRVEHALFDDIRYLKEHYDLSYDVIFFTGDLVNRGTEYDEVNEWLSDVERKFTDTGTTPLFLPVPGNHDLVRPTKDDDSYAMVREKWAVDENIRKRIWKKESDTGTWKLFRTAFENYTNWWQTTDRPLPLPLTDTLKQGLLPGDFAYTIDKNGLKIGIIGLNMAFLHLADKASGTLDVHPAQLTALLGPKHEEWLKSHAFCFLLTHHPPSWLSDRGNDEFTREVAPAGRYLLHLCGHLHETAYEEMKHGFSAKERRTLQGTSLFSYYFDKNNNQVDRRHGYSAGEIKYEAQNITLRIWSRTVNKSGQFVVDTDLIPRGEFSESFIKKKSDPVTSPPIDDEIAGLVQKEIALLLSAPVMDEFCRAALIVLAEEKKGTYKKEDIAPLLVKKGVLQGIGFIIRAWKHCCGELVNTLKSYRIILSVWENLRSVIGWLVLLSVEVDWVKKNLNTFRNKNNTIRIDLPVESAAGAEIGVARLKKKKADVVKDDSGLHGNTHIFFDRIPETGILPADKINEIKLQIYNTVVKEVPLAKYTDKAEENLIQRLNAKNETGEHQFLVLNNVIFDNTDLHGSLYNQLTRALPSLNIIKFSYGTGKSIFLISETALNQYLYEFFSKKPDLEEKG